MKIANFFIVFFFTFVFFACQDQPLEVAGEPLIEILNPVNNSNVPDTTTIKISAFDSKGIKRVELFIDNDFIRFFQKDPYEYFWETRYYDDGSQHLLEARAFDADGNKTSSKPVLVNVFKFMPSNLNAEITSDTTVHLTWNDNSKIETGFVIEVSLNDTSFIKIAEADSNVTELFLQDYFTFGKSYLFRIKAKSKQGFSGYSNTAKATFKLVSPQILDFVFLADTAISVNWRDDNYFEKFYRLKLFSTDSPYIELKTVNVDKDITTADIIFPIKKNKTYFVTISALRDQIISPPSSSLPKIFNFKSPGQIDVKDNSDNSIVMKWKSNNLFNTSYNIFRSLDGNNYSLINTLSATEFIDTNLDTTKHYYYRLTAVTINNESEPAALGVAYTPYLEKYKEVKPVSPSCFVLSKDRTKLIFAGYQNNKLIVKALDAATGNELKTFYRTLDSTAQAYNDVDLSFDGKYVATVSYAKHITLWEYDDPTKVRTINTPAYPRDFCFDPNKNVIYYTGSNNVYGINIESNSQLFKTSYSDITYNIRCSPNGKFLVFRSAGRAYIFDLTTNTKYPESMPSTSGEYEFIDDETVVVPGQSKITLWNFSTGFKEEIPISVYQPWHIALSPDKKYLFVNKWEGNGCFIDMQAKKEVSSILADFIETVFLSNYSIIDRNRFRFDYYLVKKKWVKI
ncbi:MAG: hypothetical protein AUK34_09285 [Ignavibacteria bacterium CG2_30_36_16]|nr:hypothetical protein [Ignavibacteria bacterium]OIP58408.1 MAG: hypothetical protein AUK34_09285 [Ignavibacteria bacterium CG2_30_36_16]